MTEKRKTYTAEFKHEHHHLYAVYDGHPGCPDAAAVCQSSCGLNTPRDLSSPNF